MIPYRVTFHSEFQTYDYKSTKKICLRLAFFI